MTVTHIDVQGRQNTRYFVTEFMVQYSDDGDVWRMYMGPDGEDKVDSFTRLAGRVGVKRKCYKG